MALKFLSFLFVLSAGLYAQQDIRIIRTAQNSITFEYTPVYSDTAFLGESVSIRQVTLGNGTILNPLAHGEKPQIARKLFVGLPDGKSPSIEIERTEFKTITGALPVISDEVSKIYTSRDNQFHQQTKITPSEDFHVLLGESTILRGLHAQEIIIFPVKESGIAKEIQLLKSIRIKVNFGNSAEEFEPVQDDILKSAVINFSQAAKWVKQQSRLNKPALNSVLSTGKWFKFAVAKEGIYKITRSQLSAYGINADVVDPRTIKIYSNGGTPMPENMNAPYPQDPSEIAIYISGEADGRFDQDDYILFYGRNVDFWQYFPSAQKFLRNVNPYSENNYYFITSGGSAGKRMESLVLPESASAIPVTSSTAFKSFDEDKINIGKSGRFFMGDEFSEFSKSKSYMTKLDGYVNTQPVSYRYRFVNSSSPAINLQITENAQLIYNKFLSGYGTDQYTYGVPDTATFRFLTALPEDRSVLRFTYNTTSSSSKGYLDFFEITYTRNLSAVESDELLFFSPNATNAYEYRLTDFSNSSIYVFDVTNFASAGVITNSTYPSGGEFRFSRNETLGQVRKYIAVNSAKFMTPGAGTEVKNQDLKGFTAGAKLLIISPDEFLTQAERLADYRSVQANYPVSAKTVSIQEIFNEFGGGVRDITAVRNYIRYAMDNWSIKPENVLLFGDGDYDFKNIEKANVNFIPPFETEDSFYEINSFNTDDYFGVVNPASVYIQLPVGRLPVQNLSQAKVIVDKIIKYETGLSKGLWRNTITLVADDGLTSTGNEGALHTGQSETLTTNIPASFDLKKIYLAGYPTVLTSLGRRKPGVNDAIVKAANDGTLIMNYVGHGSPELWAHEQVFVKDVTIPQIRNQNYFFLTAATCDFGYFDKTSAQSSAEVLLLKENSGAIGVFTATRPVFSSFNAYLNERFYSALLNSGRDANGLPLTLGAGYYTAKLSSTLDNDRKFHLLADPSMRLNVPVQPGTVDSVNGLSTTTVVSISALTPVSIKGYIRSQTGAVRSDFSGEGILTVYDSERNAPLPEFGSNYTIKEQGGIIYKGKVSIHDGEFRTSFVVPKDISYETKNGKILLYFYDDDEDGLAFTRNILVGSGTNPLPDDGAGPQIDIYFDDFSNTSGSFVRPNSSLILRINDQTGINTTGLGLGHKMEAVLNDDEAAAIDLSNYFTGDLDSGGKSGEVVYQFNNLSNGSYKLNVSAWDVFNNNTTETSFFTVSGSTDPEIAEVYNYPNPFSTGTHFTLQHNYPSAVDVKVKVYTIAGRLIYEREELSLTDKFVKIPWDGRDMNGDPVSNGTYLYKIVVKSPVGAVSREFLGKLSVIK